MSFNISTLLIRNLQDVFGENDPKRRRAAIYEIYSEDVVFCDPSRNVYTQYGWAKELCTLSCRPNN